jgi:kynurenine 3-monooxygenase
VLSLFLARRGYCVRLFEKRPAQSFIDYESGRSINLTLTLRGFRALEPLGCVDEIRRLCVPATARLVHASPGSVQRMPYGRAGDALYSVPRRELLAYLYQLVKAEAAIDLTHCRSFIGFDLGRLECRFRNEATGELVTEPFHHLIAADGTHSAVREHCQKAGLLRCSCERFQYGYKEFVLSADRATELRLELGVLHQWPRGRAFLIGFPSLDGSFRCILFLPHQGEVSFAAFATTSSARAFWEGHYPEVIKHAPEMADAFLNTAVGRLYEIHCEPWHVGERVLLVGDAAHAMLPFYGQGLNAACEDCAMIDRCIATARDNWDEVGKHFESRRKRDAEIITRLSKENFFELRDGYSDPRRALRRRIEARLAELFPTHFVTPYFLVAFTSLPYADVDRIQRRQNAIVDRLMYTEGIGEMLPSDEFKVLASAFVAEGGELLANA